jgi:hypothetical protein
MAPHSERERERESSFFDNHEVPKVGKHNVLSGDTAPERTGSSIDGEGVGCVCVCVCVCTYVGGTGGLFKADAREGGARGERAPLHVGTRRFLSVQDSGDADKKRQGCISLPFHCHLKNKEPPPYRCNLSGFASPSQPLVTVCRAAAPCSIKHV